MSWVTLRFLCSTKISYISTISNEIIRGIQRLPGELYTTRVLQPQANSYRLKAVVNICLHIDMLPQVFSWQDWHVLVTLHGTSGIKQKWAPLYIITKQERQWAYEVSASQSKACIGSSLQSDKASCVFPLQL